MKRFCILWVLGILLHNGVYGQYFPTYSQYLLNGLAINPAYSGSRDVLSASILMRRQWVGFDGSPTMYSLGVHMPLRNQHIGLGLMVFNETIGFEKNTGIYGNYAYRIQLGSGKLALGLKAGFNIVKELDGKITLHDPTPDKAFENINDSRFMPNFGFGAYYSNARYFAGFSLPSLLSYPDGGGNATTSPKSYNVLLSGGYLIKISDQFKLKPSTLIKYKLNTPLQYDLNLNLIFFKDDILWVGASYRNNEAFVGLVEIQVSRKFRLGYSYDYSLGPLNSYNNGSHEILLRYEWRDKVNTLNPLYF
jgi:type IX secretion system PorP/SprF family membrane protein